uniref:Protein phosphatase 2, regulatory subunit B, delta n=1 Tax=Astyanax mexicanus TaxID=7994 RepID=A0A8B9K2X7_ASTMX
MYTYTHWVGGGNDFQWCFSQVKGAIDEDVAEADIISTVEFNYSGELLATGDKGGRVVIFQREQESKNRPLSRGEYNVYSTFQSHEPEFDYLKSLEIEEKINKIRWLPQQNAAHFLLSTNGKRYIYIYVYAFFNVGIINVLHASLSDNYSVNPQVLKKS